MRLGWRYCSAPSACFPSQFTTAQYGPLESGPEAATLPEFGPAGRQPYFTTDALFFSIFSDASGFDLLVRDRLVPDIRIFVELLLLGATLPLVLLLRKRLPTVAQIRPRPGCWLS